MRKQLKCIEKKFEINYTKKNSSIYLFDNFFFKFLNNFSPLQLCKTNHLKISDTSNFFLISLPPVISNSH